MATTTMEACLAVATEACVAVASDTDIVNARRQGRALADQMGFSSSEATLVAAAISELARNIVCYARDGEIVVNMVNGDRRAGISITARDRGPGIPELKRVMLVGFSTSGGMGLGLPGVRRIMDEFNIESQAGKGTTITAIKWKR